MKLLLQHKKTGSAVLLFLYLASSAAFAQTPSSPPYKPPQSSSVAPPPSMPAWPYGVPIAGASTTPTVEKSGFTYLPFLPWTGQNVALLANYADFFYQLEKDNTTSDKTWAYDAKGTIMANNQLSQTQDSNMAAVNKTTTAQFQKQLTFFPKDGTFTNYALIPGTDTTTCKDFSPESKCMPSNNAFNADSLLGVTGFSQEMRKTEIDPLIVFLGNLTQTFTNPGFKEDDSEDKRKDLLSNKTIQDYILGIRTVSALQSMALSNFNLMAQEREVIPGLGTKAKMIDLKTASDPTPKEIPDASQVQVEKYLIDRRLNNPKWYTEMNKATSISLQRETLFVLMEMQRQIYELRMANERMLATMSTMQMTMLQMSKAQIDAKLNAEVARAANPAPPPQ